MRHKKSKHNLLIWVIEDNEALRKQARDFLHDKRTKVDVIQSLSWAMKLEDVPQIIFLDVAAIADDEGELMNRLDRGFTHQVRAFIEKHKSASIGVYSALEKWAKALIEDLKTLTPDAHVEQIDFGLRGMVDFVKKYQGGTACKT